MTCGCKVKRCGHQRSLVNGTGKPPTCLTIEDGTALLDCPGDTIIYCPLHKNAAALLKAAKGLVAICFGEPGAKPTSKFFKQVRQAITESSREGAE